MSTLAQMFPPAPTFTEKSLTDLFSKVYIITGATAGVGLELAKILYSLNATVYIGGRSLTRCNEGFQAIQSAHPTSKGTLKPFIADLSDLKTIKSAVESFLNEEHRLDVLFLNAGVMLPPEGSKTKDGYNMEIGVNCLSSFLLVNLLTPIMAFTSSHFCHPNPSIRIVWVSSCLDMGTPKGGVQFPSSTPLSPSKCNPPFSSSRTTSSTAPLSSTLTSFRSPTEPSDAPKQLKGMAQYMQSKSGAYLLAHEFSARTSKNAHGNGIMHVSLHPGFMKTELQRHIPAPARAMMGTVFKGPKYGAYTELYAGLAPDVEDGAFYWPWGRKGAVPAHIIESTENGEDGRSVSSRFYEWCEEQVKLFM
ncbi:NAD(P)-binding protein [Zopfia rhizophila CBS 207.26]|uniref:NAD(P)-binding protein n=1 Tax=Zopfia rhizophila CBS 207.26 TaxID=1314779 RepID=A0A6A6DP30_9PEZI|nr:NAD(P)-binding protein [Zopfia rhizophila CBS 207.26]